VDPELDARLRAPANDARPALGNARRRNWPTRPGLPSDPGRTAGLVLTTYGHLLPDSEERTRRAVELARCAPDVPQEAENRL